MEIDKETDKAASNHEPKDVALEGSVCDDVPSRSMKKHVTEKSLERSRKLKEGKQTPDSKKYRSALIRSVQESKGKSGRRPRPSSSSTRKHHLSFRSLAIVSIIICSMLISSAFVTIGPSAWGDGLTTVMNQMMSLSIVPGSNPIVLRDTQAPVISGLKDIVAEATSRFSVLQLTVPTVTDNVDTIPTLTNNAPSGGYPLGTNGVRWIAKDDAGNIATAIQKVTIVDTTPPVITAPPDVVVDVDSSTYHTQVPLGAATVKDLVDSFPYVSNNAPLEGFPVGKTTVTWKATDTSGNSATDTQLVSVIAKTKVIASIPGSISASSIQSSSTSSTSNSTSASSETSSSSISSSTSYSSSGGGGGGGSSSSPDTSPESETVTDTSPPMIIQPPPVFIVATGPLTMVTLGVPIVNDTIDPNPAITSNAPTFGFPLGATIVTWTATDASGNSAMAIQLVTVIESVIPDTDTNSPVLILPPDITINATGALTPVALGMPKVTNTEDPAIILTNDAPSSGSIPVGAQAYWNFDHDVEDTSGNGNNGILYGATLIQSKIGRALVFDGRDSVVVPASQNLKVNGSFSISVWIQLDTLDTENSYPRILEKKDEAGNSIQMFYSKSTRSIVFGFALGGQLQQIQSSKTDWAIGTWYHIVGTYDPSGGRNNIKLYVNGDLDNEETEVGNPLINASDLMIGAAKGRVLAYWEGQLDEIRIYDRALGATEADNLYESPFMLFPKGTTAVTWTATDKSGNSAVAKQYVSINDPTDVGPELVISGSQYADSDGVTFITSQSDFNILDAAPDVKDIYFRYYLYGGLHRDTPDFIKGQSFKIVGIDGLYKIEFYSVNSLGKAGPIHSRQVMLDNTPPNTSDIGTNFVAGTNGLTLIVHDDSYGAGAGQLETSGLYYQFDSDIDYTFVNSNSTTLRLTDLEPDTTHILRYFSRDNLGNTEPTNLIQFSFHNSCQDIPLSELKGVNFFDPIMTSKYSTSIFETNPSYTRDSFERLRQDGFNVIRVPYAWEGYEARPSEFLSQAETLASTADEFGICVVFDFHHWGVSSYIEDWRMGFPHFIMQNYAYHGGEAEVKKFWKDFYNNTIAFDGTSAWDLQVAFMRNIIARVDEYNSVLGYEILNEPAIHDLSQYAKLGKYNTYIAKELRDDTQKYILFDADRPEGIARSHSLDDLIVPSGVSKVVFAPHVYSTVAVGSESEWQMKKWKENSQLWGGVPIFIGEWASETPEEMELNAVAFKSSGLGWCYWAYAPVKLNFPYYQLIDKEYNPTANWDYLIDVSS